MVEGHNLDWRQLRALGPTLTLTLRVLSIFHLHQQWWFFWANFRILDYGTPTVHATQHQVFHPENTKEQFKLLLKSFEIWYKKGIAFPALITLGIPLFLSSSTVPRVQPPLAMLSPSPLPFPNPPGVKTSRSSCHVSILLLQLPALT